MCLSLSTRRLETDRQTQRRKKRPSGCVGKKNLFSSLPLASYHFHSVYSGIGKQPDKWTQTHIQVTNESVLLTYHLFFLLLNVVCRLRVADNVTRTTASTTRLLVSQWPAQSFRNCSRRITNRILFILEHLSSLISTHVVINIQLVEGKGVLLNSSQGQVVWGWRGLCLLYSAAIHDSKPVCMTAWKGMIYLSVRAVL